MTRLAKITSCLLLATTSTRLRHRGTAEGAASSPLNGGKYVPTTDVDYIVGLSELITAISNETSIVDGEARYKQITPNGISLESITLDTDTADTADDPGIYLDDRTNPLYSIYMYALWRSHFGSADDDADDPSKNRNDFQFLDQTVDHYGHTIIDDEFRKTSGYNPRLTAETIRATNMWMGAVQSLYDGVELCAEAGGGGAGIVVDPVAEFSEGGDFANPVDQAAAFWYGDVYDVAEDSDGGGVEVSEGKGSLYAWSAGIGEKFARHTNQKFDVNDHVGAQLVELQTMLGDCLNGDDTDMRKETAREMRGVADAAARTMTVPLVQNLIHHVGMAAVGDPMLDVVDFMILYGLVALPPIILCDEGAYDSLFDITITNGKTITAERARDAIETLYSRLVCLGITCDMIGDSLYLRDTLDTDPGLSWPACQDPLDNLKGDYPGSRPDLFLADLTADLDVRAIGALVEMGAENAAYDAYRWGVPSLASPSPSSESASPSSSAGDEHGFSMESAAELTYHPDNTVGQSFLQYHSETTSNYAHVQTLKALRGEFEFATATLAQRRIAAESIMVAMTMHAYAIDSMLRAVDACEDVDGDDSPDVGTEARLWDRGVASLSGWAQEDVDADGFLMMGMARRLCEEGGACDGPGDTAPVNDLLMEVLVEGKSSLMNEECDVAKSRIADVEKVLVTILVDMVAFFAEKIAADTSDGDNLAKGYGAAAALLPLVQPITPDSATVIESNMGTFRDDEFADIFSKDEVFDALRTFAIDARIDCTLLTREVCGGSDDTVIDEGKGSENETEGSTASAPLNGGEYVPTTDVDYIVGLTELISAIANTTSIIEGQARYREITTDGISLESITLDDTEPGIYLDDRTNPLYSIYMYALWRSHFGSGKDDNDQTRDEMEFIDRKVDNYGHTIIDEEFRKTSSYNPRLTAETIRVTNMWMGAAQSLYDAVELCDEAGGGGAGIVDDPVGTMMDDPTFLNPVDQAAAFWYGDADGAGGGDDGSLHSWAKRIRGRFDFGENPSPFDVNAEMRRELGTLKMLLSDCLRPGTEDDALRRKQAKSMRGLVDELTRAMTVPLVQNLIHHVGMVSTAEVADPDMVDYMILYGLVTLPPIIICDEGAYDSLFDTTITNGKTITAEDAYDAVRTLYSRFICLGITCDEVGNSITLRDSLLTDPDISWPTCQDPTMDLNQEYQGNFPLNEQERYLEYLKVDLDVRVIGTLVEMGGESAAYNAYQWGMHSAKSIGGNSAPMGSEGALDLFSMESAAAMSYHPDNTVGQSFLTYFPDTPNFAQTHLLKALTGQDEFATATLTQRRIISEATMVMVTMHAYAIDSMYRAVEVCTTGQAESDAFWDRGVASLSGWAQEDDHANGFLLMGVARYLCEDDGACDGPGDTSPVNDLLMEALIEGRSSLMNEECDVAKVRIVEAEKLLVTILVDLVAFVAEKIAADTSDGDNLAEGYGAAVALIPLMQPIAPDAAIDIESNMGTFPNDALTFSKDDVFDALRIFVTEAQIVCTLLTREICEGVVEPPTPSPNPTSFSDDDWLFPTFSPVVSKPTDETLGIGEDNATSSDRPMCGHGIDGGVPSSVTKTEASMPLLGGAYVPTSNVDHIIRLTESLSEIAKSSSMLAGRQYYEQVEDGVSLECLSTGVRWVHITASNPLYVIYMYGLWTGDDGDEDGDGYSNKMFDDGEILNYGDTIINDEFKKSSGFDSQLTADTIRIMNMWMATITEVYRAASSCRDGYVDESPEGFNPVDFAAAFWFGSEQDADSTEGWSLYSWAKKAEEEYIGQSTGVNDDIIDLLENMQRAFNDCRAPSDGAPQETRGIEMKGMADEIARMMTVPLVQHFIHNLAEESGMATEESDERNRMVLYALGVLPFISICDEDSYDFLYYDLVSNIDSYDSGDFIDHIKTIYSRLECLGITCDMVGESILASENWPKCKPPSATTEIAGYSPTTDSSLQMLKFDLDIGTILAFIVMEANHAALDIYENGRNVKDEYTYTYVPLNVVKEPQDNQESIEVYQAFTNPTNSDVDYTLVTKNAILGKEEFLWSSPLQNSAAASLAIATIDMHLSMLDDMKWAIINCRSGGNWADNWDSAVAAMVGWTVEAIEDDEVTGVDDYLLFQLAEELCVNFETCGVDEPSRINVRIIGQFMVGRDRMANSQCDEAEYSVTAIEKDLQATLVDNLAYHTKLAASDQADTHCLMAYVARNALVPLMRSVNETSAKTIEDHVVASAIDCVVDDVEAVYQALHEHVIAKGIDCTLLGSSVCDGTSTTVDLENNSEYTPNIDDADGKYTIFSGEYEPMTNVERLHSVSTVVNAICDADDKEVAKNTYLTAETAGLSIKSMSISAKYAMADELQYNQYVYALQDSVDKTDGSLSFDGKPAGDYADTISIDALDTSVLLGCSSVKVLNIWMWTVHKLNDAINACKDPVTPVTGELDEAAALWDGGLLFDMAEQLGPKFGQVQVDSMTPLNRNIVDRLNKAREIILKSDNKCDYIEVHDLRIIVKETVSYMTAVLIQSFIDSMLGESPIREKQEMVELMSFVVLPHIKTCGHEAASEKLYNDLVGGGFEEHMISDTLSVLQSHYNCLGLSCDEIGRHTATSSAHPLCSDNHDIAGYTPINATKTNMLAKLDLDAVAIHQMMSMEKSEVAKRIYFEGHNYYDYDNQADYSFVSLHNLTQSHTIEFTDFEMYQLYSENLGEDFGNSLVVDAMDRRGIFRETTAAQRDLAVNVAISSIVSYMSALEALYLSVSVCESNQIESATAFDGAVALLIGSVEGRGLGGNVYQEGRMFYSIGKRTCNHFRTCRGGDAEANVELFSALKEGQDLIQQGDCGELADVAQTINAVLKVPLMQSLLYFSDKTILEQSDDDAAGYVATMAVYPILADIDPIPANTIKSNMEDFRLSLMDSEALEDTVHGALSDVFSNPKTSTIVDCLLVTNLDEICSSDETPDDGTPNGPVDIKPEIPVSPEEPMPISNGLYVATNYVGDRSAISLDVQEIRERMKAKKFKRAKVYYNEGENSKIYDENGIPTGELRSIAGFSTESSVTMRSDPTYNLFVYGLSDEKQEFLGRPATKYADSFISDLLFLEAPEAPDAMIAITIWMQVAHSLHSAHHACKIPFLTDGGTVDGRHLQNSDPALFIDEAAAYWIGDNQATGSSSRGHLLYALTEEMGGMFEQIPDGAESNINAQIIEGFNKAKNHIAISRGCSTSKNSHLKLKGIIDELIPLMAVPLLRHLLHHLSTDNPVMVKIFATAVLPLFSACSSSTYRELKDLLIDHDVIEMQKEYIFSKIQSLYSCLGLTCDLVGHMEQEECDDSSDLKSLAGYRYVSDQQTVNKASQIDIDMRKVEIFIQNGMTQFKGSQEILFGTAFGLYNYGQHSKYTEYSLSSMARDTNRNIVPSFVSFRRYFGSDANYVDTMLVNAFQKEGVFQLASADQRKRFIVFSLNYMLTYMTTLEKLYSSVRSCKYDDRKEAAVNLDLAAGYFVGSLEGKEDGGSFDGSLIFMLAKRMCVHFGTCTSSNHARINERIISLFYTSQGEIETGACESLERTVKEIENSMIVPMIQGVLYSARENEIYYKQRQGTTKSIGTEFYPEGFALAQSILPIIEDADTNAAKEIAAVMVDSFPFSSTDVASNDSAKVHRAVRTALIKLDGVDCSQIGSLGGQGFCPGDAAPIDNLSPASHTSTSLVLLVITGVLLFALY